MSITQDSRHAFFDQFSWQTQCKTELLKSYFGQALPVYLNQSHVTNILIADLFSGPGQDASGNDGSPAIIMKVICEMQSFGMDKSIDLWFNDANQAHARILGEFCCEFDSRIKPRISALPAEKAFEELLKKLNESRHFSFLYFDQFGVSFMDRNRFKQLASQKHCDVLFFISSSRTKHFKHELGVQKLGMDPDKIDASAWDNIHDVVCEHYKGLLPPGTSNRSIFIQSFKFKKGSNINGLIFMTHHLAGLERFVKAKWKVDEFSGSESHNNDSPELFELGELECSALYQYKKNLRSEILNGSIVTRRDLIIFMLTNGMLRCHTEDVLKDLQQKGVIKKGRIALSAKSLDNGQGIERLIGDDRG